MEQPCKEIARIAPECKKPRQLQTNVRAAKGDCAASCSAGATAAFSAHNQVRVGESDAEGRSKLAGYMLRAPMALE